MFRNFKHLINIPDGYIDILMKNVERLDEEEFQDVVLYVTQRDHDLNQIDRPIFRQKIRLLIDSVIKKTSFYATATKGKSELIEKEFLHFLRFAVEYRIRGGFQPTEDQIEHTYQHIIKMNPGLTDTFVFAIEGLIPNSHTKISRELEIERLEVSRSLPHLVRRWFSTTDLFGFIRETQDEACVTLSSGLMFRVFHLTIKDHCFELAKQYPR